jgi:hypothetical protein
MCRIWMGNVNLNPVLSVTSSMALVKMLNL